MKRNLLILTFISFITLPVFSQKTISKIISENKINISEYPIANRIYEADGKTLKSDYSYLENIELIRIKYSSDGLAVDGWIAKPRGNDMHPAIIWNRGGNQEFGALDKMYKPLFFLGKLASEGYYVIASNYRGNCGGEGKEEFGGADVNDVINLIDVIDAAPEADGDRIGMHGWSRGGMMTYQALIRTNRIKAVVVGGAVTDHIAGLQDRPGFEDLFIELIPDFEANREKELTKRSAVYWVDQFPKNVPILVMHGGSDWRVKPEQSLRMALEFDKYRIPYRLIIYEGADHGISEFRSETHQETTDWFNRFLRDGEAMPDMEFHGK
jgi:dipeptidyl aminopeptidase/acylaminoacyl peptidase